MSIKTIEAIVENGHIRLPSPLNLPEKARVYVLVPDNAATSVSYVGSPRLANPEQAADFQKEVTEESRNADL